jgi:hypothetical protein
MVCFSYRPVFLWQSSFIFISFLRYGIRHTGQHIFTTSVLGFIVLSDRALYHYQKHCTTIRSTVPPSEALYHHQKHCTTIRSTVPLSEALYRYQKQCTAIRSTIPLSEAVYHYQKHCTTLRSTVPP